MSIELCMPLLRDEDIRERYVERKELEAELRRIVESGFLDRRFVFVYGVGGSGKTTLINKVLRDLGYDYVYIQVVDEGERYHVSKKVDFSEGETAYWIVKRIYESLRLREKWKDVASKLYDGLRIVMSALGFPQPPSLDELRKIIGRLESSEFERIVNEAYKLFERAEEETDRRDRRSERCDP